MIPSITKGMPTLLITLLLTACATPVLRQPYLALPATFKEDASSARVLTASDGRRWKRAQPAEQRPRGHWWLTFDDPALNALIDEATRNNANLAAATARVQQARALAGTAEAERTPQVGAGLNAHRGRLAPAELGLAPGTPVAAQTTYAARLTASYDVDLFGRVSSTVAAASGDANAAEATRLSVLLALQADVAQTYMRVRALDGELDTLIRTVNTREENVKVNQRRFELGDIGEFDLARARTELSISRAEAISIQRLRAVSEHALAVLLGKPAASLTVLAKPLDESPPPVIPAGLPSDLLERRPDIVAAQRAMEAANARIGVARAAMFPALNLNASGGGVSGALSDVLKTNGQSWLLGALLSAPLMDGGRNRANVMRSEAALDEAVAEYRQRVLVAFADVEDNLSGLRILEEQAAQIDDALVSARRSADLARKLYEAGRSSYLDLLDAQRNLAAVERSAVQLRGNRLITTVALIRALGGGWDTADRYPLAIH